MGDRLGIPGVIDILFLRFNFSNQWLLHNYCSKVISALIVGKICKKRFYVSPTSPPPFCYWISLLKLRINLNLMSTPYHVESFSPCLITKDKQRRAWLVLGWVTWLIITMGWCVVGLFRKNTNIQFHINCMFNIIISKFLNKSLKYIGKVIKVKLGQV